MRVLIVGGGRMGRGLARRLRETQDEPIILELDEDRAYELTKKLSLTVINGDGTDPDILKKAGIEKADALVAVTSNDEANIMICKLGKNFNVPRVISRVNEDGHTSIFEDLGADITINSIASTIGLYERAVRGPELYGLLSLGGSKVDAVEVKVKGNSEADGKTIEELDIPELCTISMITRKGELIPPRGNTKFQKNDRVILVGKSDDVNSLSKVFRDSSPGGFLDNSKNILNR